MIWIRIGKKYKVVYKDDNYSKILIGTLIKDEQFLITLKDRKIGEIDVGKNFIVSIKEMGDQD